MLALARQSAVVLFGAFLLAQSLQALSVGGEEDSCVHLTGYGGPAKASNLRPSRRPGSQLDAGICAVDNARANGAFPTKTNADFVPITGDDSLGFYCVYGVRASTSGGVGGNVGIFLFELTGGEVLVFGSGYGNIQGANLFDAAYDMERVDQVIRFCMGRTPAQTPLRIVAPHGHGDHINSACNRELERLGYRILEIAFHQGDAQLVNGMSWTGADRALFRLLPASQFCLEELASYSSPLGKIWFYDRPGHTAGSIDLVIDVLGDPNNRFVVRGSQPSSPCAPIPGMREIVNAHGNMELVSIAPSLSDVTPLAGTSLGGTPLTLTGVNFTIAGAGTHRVLVNGTPATEVVVVNDTTLTCKTPAGPPGQLVEVAVVNNNGKALFAGTYLYNALPTLTSISPTSGDWRGGTVVQVRGSGFLLSSGVNEVFFGAKKGTSLSIKSDIWTRVCFCGQQVEGGKVADESQVGIPFLTGSEEERGPLFDVTKEHFESRRAPVGTDPHGRKIFPPGTGGGVPRGVPLIAVRVGDRMIASLPGEGTKEAGARIKAAATAAVAGSGIETVVLSGLANEFVLYFTTPEEYEKQHYEGGNTHFGRVSSVLMRDEIAKLAGTLARGAPPPAPFDFDPTNGVIPDGTPFSSGAATGSATAQPAPAYARLQHATFSWKGGPKGLDRPVDRAFVTAQRRKGRRWVRADSDLGLAMLWTVDDDGLHNVKWEIPLEARPGRYRLLVTAKRYRLASRPFRVNATKALKAFAVPARRGRVAVGLLYPGARRDIDLTHRPQYSRGGVVRFRVGNRTVRVKRRRGRFFSVRAPRGKSVTVPAGKGRDRFGNRNGAALRLR